MPENRSDDITLHQQITMKESRQIPQNQQHYTKAIDITFTIVLVFFTLVFGDYVLKSINQPQKASVKKASSNVVTVAAVKQHPVQKHRLKILHINRVEKQSVETAQHDTQQKTDEAAALPVKTDVVAAAPGNPVQNKTTDITPVTVVKTTPEYLYATYLTSNETGVINMRKADFYNAEVIKTIPTNSNVYILAKGDVYYKIRFDNSTGYVPKWTVAAQ